MKAEKTTLTAVVLGVFVLTALFCMKRFFDGQHEESALHCHDVRAAVEDEADSILDAPPRIPDDGVRKAAIQAMCDTVCIAYSNCQYEVILKFEDEVPRVLEVLLDKDFAQATAGLYKLLSGELSGQCESPRRFNDICDFSAWAKANIAATKLYGKACLRRKSGGEVSCRFEALMLSRLTSYRELFAAEGRTEFIRVADDFMSDWIGHIESAEGFSKSRALYWLEYSRRWGQNAYGKREDWAVLRDKAICQGSKWLVRAGYTPKWVEELEKSDDN